MKPVSKNFFARDALLVARELLGKVIEYKGVSGMIVETEGYKRDPASHAYKITPRSRIMLETYGRVYVYFTYGMHWCLNFTTNRAEVGAVLVRAIEPLAGIEKMKRRRKTKNILNLCSGPAKLTQALGITGKLNGTKIGKSVNVYNFKSFKDIDVLASGRIGVSSGKNLPWRFFVKDSPFVSRNIAVRKQNNPRHHR